MEEKNKNKYHNGKIYTLRSYQTDKFYIGSTCQLLSRRKAEHKLRKRNDISKLDDFYIELLENFKCENKDELNKREGELIRQNKNKCINKNVAGRTGKEYREENKEKIKTNDKIFRDNNKEKIKEYQKQYRLKNKLKD